MSLFGSNTPRINEDTPTITVEGISFFGVNGDAKLKLLPEPWPTNNLPRPTASLLSISSRKSLLAAAYPSGVVIANTDKIREALKADGAKTANNVKSFEPQLTLTTPRISHVAFSSNNKYLTICADEGGGLAVYEVDTLVGNGSREPAFQINTEGIQIRALIPNPSEDYGHIMALVLADGKLMCADLNAREIVKGSNGAVIHDSVSCASWSAKGKQLVAGLGDGRAVQMTQDGQVKAEIPYPSGLQGDHHISSMLWLNNDQFFIIYTPTSFPADQAPSSRAVLVSIDRKTTTFDFKSLGEPCFPSARNRSPPHHFISRLRDFPPHLLDALILSSSASSEIDVFTKSDAPLASDADASAIVGNYAATQLAADSSRAGLPMSEDMSETSPIGVALDLSSKQLVTGAIPQDEMDQSATPLPQLVVLSDEGLLSSWWFVYADSIRQRVAFPGLIAAMDSQPSNTSPFSTTSQAMTTFGSPQTSASPFAQPFSSGTNQSTFGTSTQPAFGSTSSFGQSPSPWSNNAQSSAPAFGQPSFGTTSAFGAPSQLSGQQSVWGSNNTQAQASPFASKGTTFGGNTNANASPFGQLAGNQAADSNSSPFGKLASGNASSPFAAFKADQNQSPFTKPSTTTQASFGSTVTISSGGLGSSFGSPSLFNNQKSPWATPSLSNKPSSENQPPADTSADADMDMDGDANANQAKEQRETASTKQDGQSGLSSTGFKLHSTFEATKESTAGDEKTGASDTSGGLFGKNFAKSLGEASTTNEPKIKIEPSDDNVKTKDLSDAKGKPASPKPVAEPAPLPPSPTISKPAEIEPAPLPPSPTVAKPAEIVPEPAPLPPSPTVAKPAEVVPEPAPLPPSPTTKDQPAEDALSPAGTPPIDLGGESTSPHSSRSEKETEDGQHVQQRIASAPLQQQPTWNFGSLSQGVKSPFAPPSEQQTGDDAQTPFTFASGSAAKPPILFSRPDAQSPRSPSPVRRDQIKTLGSPLRNRSRSPPKSQPATNNFAATFLPPQPTNQPLSAGLPNLANAPPAQSLFGKTSDQLSDIQPVREKRVEPEPQVEPELDAYDEQAAQIEAELATPNVPTKRLAPFLAHQDYVGQITSNEGVPTQLERLYRDIQSMVDTLGLNARALEAFVRGHTELLPDGGRDRDALERPSDWAIAEVEDLEVIEKELSEQLEAGRPMHVREKVLDIRHAQLEMTKLRQRNKDYARIVSVCKDESSSADAQRARSAPLTAEQALRLKDVRHEFVKVQQLLSKVEGDASVLESKVAQESAAQDQENGTKTKQVPTVEAIINTINKMTRMAEEKRGDIDVLEARLAKLIDARRAVKIEDDQGSDLGLSRLSLGASRRAPLSSNGGSSPFVTPDSSKKKTLRSSMLSRQSRSPTPGTYELDYSEDEDEADLNRVARSMATMTVAEKDKDAVSDDQIHKYRQQKAKKAQVMEILKSHLSSTGPKTITVNNEA